MLTGSGPSGLMYILRARAREAERGEDPSLVAQYGPAEPSHARRRLLVVWVLCSCWIPFLVLHVAAAMLALVPALVGVLLAIATQVEGAWIGSPVRPWTLYAIPVAFAGGVAVALLA